MVRRALAGTGRLEVAPERLVELVYRLRESKAAAVVDAIFDDVDSCCEGASATDDRTVVVIKR